MKNVSSILLAIDGDYDHQALAAEVEAIARDDCTDITIFSITEPASGRSGVNVAVPGLPGRKADTRAMQLARLAGALADTGRQVSVQHGTGAAHLEIIRRTLDGEYDLVMKPAKNYDGISRFFLGGADVQLLNLCPIPVWIFQPTARKALKRVAVAVDLQPDDPERHALADKVLKWGKLVTDLSDTELHIIHTWSLYREESLRSKNVFSDIIDNLSASKEQLHCKWLYEALRRAGLDDDGIHEHLVKGDVRRVIPGMMAELDIDLLVLGTVGRTGIPGFFIGNTADSILRNVDCSVFAVKPENFTAPIAC